jgi:2-C-methyl-D-erythritol 4-phosphate cytidylyltransferase
MRTTTAIVLAAGSGIRMGGATPKPFHPLAGRPIVLRALDRMFAASTVTSVVLVIAPPEMERCKDLLQSDDSLRNRRWLLQSGGATRQHSARRGLELVAPDCELVLLHDAARPFVTPALIDRCVETASEKGAVVLGLPVRDTIKEVSLDRWIRATPERSLLWEIQTPQVFHRELILLAHAQAARDGILATDDAMVVERTGARVYVLDGERTNIKITLPEDLRLAELMIRDGVVR